VVTKPRKFSDLRGFFFSRRRNRSMLVGMENDVSRFGGMDTFRTVGLSRTPTDRACKIGWLSDSVQDERE